MSTDRAPILVIGYGNALRGDDAFGPYVAEKLLTMVDELQVRVLIRRCLTPELALDLATAPRAVFIDASVDGAAGQVVCHHVSGSRQPAAH